MGKREIRELLDGDTACVRESQLGESDRWSGAGLGSSPHLGVSCDVRVNRVNRGRRCVWLATGPLLGAASAWSIDPLGLTHATV